MSTVVERLTADEYLARDDPRRTELIDGVVVVNEPGNLHQFVCSASSSRSTPGRRARADGARRSCR